MELQEFKELARRAHYNISFDPDKRGDQIINDYSEELSADIETINGLDSNEVERYVSNYKKYFSSWLSAKSRCISSMITGPANFPVRRAEKANNSEHKRYEEWREWRERALKAITRKNTEPDFIRMNESDTLAKLEKKLEGLERNQQLMKDANKIIRDKKGNKELRLIELGLSAEIAAEILQPGRFTGMGYAGFELRNNSASIQRVRQQIEQEKLNAMNRDKGNKEYEVGIAKVLENVEENRLQLLFDGKPDQEIISKLKSNGFRWSPRNMAWQRQLTQNAIWAAKRVLS